MEKIHRSLGAAVDRIVQRQARKAVFVGNLSGDGYLFDGAGVIITAWTRQRNLRRVGFACLNEKILADANGLALLNTGDVIDAVAFHLDGGVIDVVLPARELDLLTVVELELAARKRPVGGDVE